MASQESICITMRSSKYFLCLEESSSNTNEKIERRKGNVASSAGPIEPQLLGFMPCDFGLAS